MGEYDNGNQLYLHYKYDSSTLSFSIKDVATTCSAHPKGWACSAATVFNLPKIKILIKGRGGANVKLQRQKWVWRSPCYPITARACSAAGVFWLRPRRAEPEPDKI